MDQQRVLPEVRPYVRNMPEDPYVMLTGGSARSREIESDDVGNFTIVNVTGVPNHTHNATAIAHISCDFEEKYAATHVAEPVDPVWAREVEIAIQDRYDSAIIEDEEVKFDRALEKGIGSIRLLPENCHNEDRKSVV